MVSFVYTARWEGNPRGFHACCRVGCVWMCLVSCVVSCPDIADQASARRPGWGGVLRPLFWLLLLVLLLLSCRDAGGGTDVVNTSEASVLFTGPLF